MRLLRRTFHGGFWRYGMFIVFNRRKSPQRSSWRLSAGGSKRRHLEIHWEQLLTFSGYLKLRGCIRYTPPISFTYLTLCLSSLRHRCKPQMRRDLCEMRFVSAKISSDLRQDSLEAGDVKTSLERPGHPRWCRRWRTSLIFSQNVAGCSNLILCFCQSFSEMWPVNWTSFSWGWLKSLRAGVAPHSCWPREARDRNAVLSLLYAPTSRFKVCHMICSPGRGALAKRAKAFGCYQGQHVHVIWCTYTCWV